MRRPVGIATTEDLVEELGDVVEDAMDGGLAPDEILDAIETKLRSLKEEWGEQ